MSHFIYLCPSQALARTETTALSETHLRHIPPQQGPRGSLDTPSKCCRNDHPTNLESDELLLPGMQPRQADLFEGFMAQAEIDAIRGDRELEGHSLVSLCHLEW